ncbi:MAG: helix-turn-helix domain-containing protein, partial [Marinibacterium sp.]
AGRTRGGGECAAGGAADNLDLVQQRHILHVLDKCGGNRAEAARRLGVSRKTIDRKCAAWSV